MPKPIITYECEICGLSFDSYAECFYHEKTHDICLQCKHIEEKAPNLWHCPHNPKAHQYTLTCVKFEPVFSTKEERKKLRRLRREIKNKKF